jgi:AbrB family looped-hinge helix DNA binding protein
VVNVEASRVGKRGAVVIPARLRKRFGLEEGAFVIAEERPEASCSVRQRFCPRSHAPA